MGVFVVQLMPLAVFELLMNAKLGMNEQHRSPIAIKKWMAVCKHAHDEAGPFVHLLFILGHRQTL